ncbi:hypothetical protein STM14_0136 [Salmonella enterica subsp. enterica serovar Typhimurium str. 14028S]|uniref:Uncharacterized protein n=1 Tax=Salmonella typhimurium (strain 14028s / SGSC 2262) TaxID=588858 RepID=A0A0F6AWQ2_SALT1|nr:hypothetical protein STM14_0136 [Salmonella enterica subsp. enterica serovar Typhimurium str. 14028S]
MSTRSFILYWTRSPAQLAKVRIRISSTKCNGDRK